MAHALPHDVWEWIGGYEGTPLAWLAWLQIPLEEAAARKLQRAAREMLERSHVPLREGVRLRVQYRRCSGRETCRRWRNATLYNIQGHWVAKMDLKAPKKWYIFMPNDRVRVRW